MTEKAAKAQEPRLFGTDGIRGEFGLAPLDEATVVRVGLELGKTLVAAQADGQAPAVLAGGDTRDSTPQLAAWLASGLEASGVVMHYLGTAPTPAVAYLVRSTGAAAGIAISASHNRHPDNGIKLLDAQGFKWSVTAERELEARIAAVTRRSAEGDAVEPTRRIETDGAALAAYLDGLAQSVPPGALESMRICLDTANGAASPFAGPLFARLGAHPEVLHDAPDGTNINRECGSTHLDGLVAAMRAGSFDLGAAFDGDADRVLLVDSGGAVHDGDALLFLWARALLRDGRLDPPAVVATTMSNLGLERALAREGIELVRCDVGDRAVVESLREHGLVLGGEQSGHIVHLGHATTGDGMLTALQIAAIVQRSGHPLDELVAGFERYPQVLRNVPVEEKRPFDELPGVAAAAAHAEEQLGRDGRLLLRYSGTEPLARIMLEGPDEAELRDLAARIAGALHKELGGAS